ncbi:unnamed protein product [Lota lota]
MRPGHLRLSGTVADKALQEMQQINNWYARAYNSPQPKETLGHIREHTPPSHQHQPTCTPYTATGSPTQV